MNTKVNYKNVVHVGLGKTATTTLQQEIFPLLPNLRPELKYNDPNILNFLRKINCLTKKDISSIKDLINEGNNFISYEGLLSWNPREWENSCEILYELFGDNICIIITVRDTISYLTSVYQQIIQEGNVIRPQHFFLKSSEYDCFENFIPKSMLIRFDVDSFDLVNLHRTISRRFRKVVFVSVTSLKEFSFLQEIYNLSDEEKHYLTKRFQNSKRKNVSYSSIGMKLTFQREALFNSFGATTFGSWHNNWKSEFLPLKHDIYNLKYLKYSELKLTEKIIQFPFRFLRRIKNVLKWRKIVQIYVNRYLPYQKYTLPKDIYMNKELLESNDRFIEKI